MAYIRLAYSGEMSGDEIALGVVATGIWVATSLAWLRRLRERRHVPGTTPWKGALASSPILAAALVLVVLRIGAASDVREDARYLWMYTALGGAWVGCALGLSPIVGLSARDDVVERRNPAAAIALLGLAIATAIAYAGGNVGDGPGWWVVLVSSGLSTLVLAALVWVALSWGRAGDAITVDRDVATGARFALVAVAESLVLARAVAGDWVSIDATLADLASRGWFVCLLAGAALVFERSLQPNRNEPRRAVFACGVLPGLVAVAAAAAWILYLGAPS